MVISAIGYRYFGPDSGYSEYSIGGQVTLDMVVTGGSLTIGSGVALGLLIATVLF